jgi:hypothetical protein
LKERVVGSRGLAAVRGVSPDGRDLFGIVELARGVDDDWRLAGGTWGLENPTGQELEPFANFAGGWGPDGCWAGGRVHGEAVHHVRMVDASGENTVEDTVDDGVALLLLDAPCVSPCTVELYDAAGALLRTQPHAPPGPTPIERSVS